MKGTKAMVRKQTLEDALRDLLISRNASTQEEVCLALERQGYEINQSKASRLLRKIGATKITNEKGQVVYSLPREPAPPSMDTTIRHLILDIVANEMLVVIFTSPGSASMVARVLDYKQISTEILGTLAGDDTIFVAPKSIKDTQKLMGEIQTLLRE
jgi:transcriptional regulator of arginine metabolism